VIPARRFEYGLSFGGCRAVTCTANGNADLRYGLSDRWTIRGGIDQFWRDSLPALSHPYLGLAGGFGNAWGLEVEAVANAVLRGLLRYEPSLGIRLSTEFNQFATGPVQPILTPYGRRTQWTTTAAVQPLHRRDDLWVEGSLDRIADVIGNTTSGRLGVSFYQSQFRLAPALRFTRFTSAAGIAANESFASLNVFSFPFPQLGPILGTVTGRGAWEVDHHGETTTMAGYLARPIGSAVNLEVGAGWNRGAGTSLSIYLSTQFPAVRATTSVTVPSRGPATGNQFVQGSLLYDRGNRQVGFAAGPSVERAGVSGRVFLDQNGDGRWQDDEDLLTDVTIIAGYTSVKSDEAGRYRIWDLPAFEPTLVTVDSASLASPLWIPTYGSVSIETAPNRFRSLDIPIVPGGVIEGRLVRASPDGWAPVAGVKLTLVRRGTREARELVTFSDGGFYLLGVKPGDYELTAEAAVLKRLGLEGESLSFAVPASAEGATVEGLELRLR
jgi:hypothetical protein